MRKALHILFLVCFSLSGFAQEEPSVDVPRQPFLQLNYHTGSFWTRSAHLVEQFSDPYKAIEARFGYQLTGKKMWQQQHNYPKCGFGIHYSDLVKDKSDTVVGNPFSLFGFYSAPWYRFGRFTLASDMSVGLSYTDLIYDPLSNPRNDVIASHINLYFDFNLNLSMLLTRRLSLYAGYGLTHYSNGRIQMPQKGVNNWGLTMGIHCLLKEPISDFIYNEPPEFKSFESVQLMYAVGLVESIVTDTREELQFFTSSFSADYVYQFSPKGALAFGLDVFYDGSLKRAIKGIAPEDVTSWQQIYLGSHLGYHFIVDRLTILLDLGTYFRQHSYDRGYYFARAGGRYQFTDLLSGHLCIKSKNGIRSDWIEWGVATSLKIR
jgi:Lipid A 3-O-deacylase (PagL)